jgi:hypothetical protein
MGRQEEGKVVGEEGKTGRKEGRQEGKKIM